VPRNVLQIYGCFGGIQCRHLLYLIYSHDKGKIVLCHVLKAYRGSRGVAPLILYDSTRSRWVLNFTPQLLYPRGKIWIHTK